MPLTGPACNTIGIALKWQSHMERCSIEILHEIFAIACTDGGQTGCALSLVSRRIHYASFGVRFHTVALFGIYRMRSFQRMLELQKSSPPIVKHLFFHNVPAPPRSPWERRVTRRKQDEIDVAISIVSTIAPSLLSLFATYDQAIRPGSRFPLLQDLSLGASSISRVPIQSHNPPYLPKLRRLHKWGKDSLHGVDDMAEIASIIGAAPKLARIRFSNSQPVQLVISALRVASKCDGASEAENDDEGTKLRLPASLEWVAYQSEELVGAWRDEREIRKRVGRGRVIILPEGTYTNWRCMQDWLDVIRGERGCWGISRCTGPDWDDDRVDPNYMDMGVYLDQW